MWPGRVVLTLVLVALAAGLTGCHGIVDNGEVNWEEEPVVDIPPEIVDAWSGDYWGMHTGTWYGESLSDELLHFRFGEHFGSSCQGEGVVFRLSVRISRPASPFDQPGTWKGLGGCSTEEGVRIQMGLSHLDITLRDDQRGFEVDRWTVHLEQAGDSIWGTILGERMVLSSVWETLGNSSVKIDKEDSFFDVPRAP